MGGEGIYADDADKWSGTWLAQWAEEHGVMPAFIKPGVLASGPEAALCKE